MFETIVFHVENMEDAIEAGKPFSVCGCRLQSASVRCAEKSFHMGIGSTNSFGAPDLDTRPPEMQRSTIYHWTQRCPSCGYCAADILKDTENIRELVQKTEYRNIVKNNEISETGASFLAFSHEKQQWH